MTEEFKESKVGTVKQEVPDVDYDECLTTLQAFGWDAVAATRHLKLLKLTRY